MDFVAAIARPAFFTKYPELKLLFKQIFTEASVSTIEVVDNILLKKGMDPKHLAIVHRKIKASIAETKAEFISVREQRVREQKRKK